LDSIPKKSVQDQAIENIVTHTIDGIKYQIVNDKLHQLPKTERTITYLGQEMTRSEYNEERKASIDFYKQWKDLKDVAGEEETVGDPPEILPPWFVALGQEKQALEQQEQQELQEKQALWGPRQSLLPGQDPAPSDGSQGEVETASVEADVVPPDEGSDPEQYLTEEQIHQKYPIEGGEQQAKHPWRDSHPELFTDAVFAQRYIKEQFDAHGLKYGRWRWATVHGLNVLPIGGLYREAAEELSEIVEDAKPGTQSKLAELIKGFYDLAEAIEKEGSDPEQQADAAPTEGLQPGQEQLADAAPPPPPHPESWRRQPVPAGFPPGSAWQDENTLMLPDGRTVARSEKTAPPPQNASGQGDAALPPRPTPQQMADPRSLPASRDELVHGWVYNVVDKEGLKWVAQYDEPSGKFRASQSEKSRKDTEKSRKDNRAATDASRANRGTGIRGY